MNGFDLIKYKNATQSSKVMISEKAQKKNNEISFEIENEEGNS